MWKTSYVCPQRVLLKTVVPHHIEGGESASGHIPVTKHINTRKALRNLLTPFTPAIPTHLTMLLKTLRNILGNWLWDLNGSYCYCLSYSYWHYVNIIRRNIGSGVINSILLYYYHCQRHYHCCIQGHHESGPCPVQWPHLPTTPPFSLPRLLELPPKAHVLLIALSLRCSSKLSVQQTPTHPLRLKFSPPWWSWPWTLQEKDTLPCSFWHVAYSSSTE